MNWGAVIPPQPAPGWLRVDREQKSMEIHF
jgi:hypothetical protein